MSRPLRAYLPWTNRQDGDAWRSRKSTKTRRRTLMHTSTRSPSETSPPPALRRGAELLLLGVIPVVALALALSAYAGDGRLALDFHEELYPQANAVVHGETPYPDTDSEITDTTNAIWPIAAVLPALPLTTSRRSRPTGPRRVCCSPACS